MFRIGARLPHDKLFNSSKFVDSDSDNVLWYGSPISEEQLDAAREILTQAVEEVDGKVCAKP